MRFKAPIDLAEEITHVVLDRQVLLALERRGAGVRRLIVEPDVAGHVRLCRREGTLDDRGELRVEMVALLQEARAEVLEFLRGELGLGHGGEG